MSEPKGANILIIDDELQIQRFLGISLQAQGYAVSEVGSGHAGLEALATLGADLVILDLDLLDLDGLDVLRELRGLVERAGDCFVGARQRSGKSTGARCRRERLHDQTIRRTGTVGAMRALLRLQTGGDAASIFDDGVLRIDLGRCTVARDGEPITLSCKEWAMFALLMKHSGRAVTQPQMLRELWVPTHQEDTYYLLILAAKLRTKLGEDAAAPRYIQTEAGVGLRFISGTIF